MNWSYFYKHWFGTLLLGPIIAMIIEYYTNENSQTIFGFLEVYPIFLIVGLMYSTPTYILYGFIYYFLGQKNINLIFSKIVLIFFAVNGVIITFWLLGGSWSIDGILSYCIASMISGLYFTLDFK